MHMFENEKRDFWNYSWYILSKAGVSNMPIIFTRMAKTTCWIWYQNNEAWQICTLQGRYIHRPSSISLFCLSGEVPENESLFLNSTPQGMEKLDISNYVPVFLDEKTDQLPQRNGTDAMCGDIVQCKFDFQVTGNEAIAKSTAKFIENFKVLQEDLMKGMYKYIH